MFGGPLSRMRLPGFPGQPPITPEAQAPGPDTTEIERWYAELMRPPSLLERIGQGVEVPNTPLVSPKGRKSRLFLRGLVGGFKSSQEQKAAGRAGGSSALRSVLGRGAPGAGRATNPEYEAARVDAMKALAEARRARASEIGEADDIDPLLEDKRAAIKALEAQRKAAASAAGRRAAAYEKRASRAPTGRGGGSSSAAYNAERATLNARREAALSRMKAEATKLWGEPEGPYAKPLAISGYARFKARVEAEYRQKLDALDKKYGMGAGIPMPDEDEEDLY